MQNCISRVKVKMNDNLGVHSQKLKKKSSSLKENKNFIFVKKVHSQENKKVFFTVFVTEVSSVQSYKTLFPKNCYYLWSPMVVFIFQGLSGTAYVIVRERGPNRVTEEQGKKIFKDLSNN